MKAEAAAAKADAAAAKGEAAAAKGDAAAARAALAMRRKSGLGIVLEMMQAELEYMIELMREDDRQERQHAQEQWRAIQADTKRLKDAERRQDREFEAELDRLSKQYQVGERGKRR